VIRIITTIFWVLLWPTCHLSAEFCENRLSSFGIILLTNKQTRLKRITSLEQLMTISNTAWIHNQETKTQLVWTCSTKWKMTDGLKEHHQRRRGKYHMDHNYVETQTWHQPSNERDTGWNLSSSRRQTRMASMDQDADDKLKGIYHAVHKTQFDNPNNVV